LGSLVPWLTSPVKPFTYSIFLWAGIIVMLGGVVICSAAGSQREKSHSRADGIGANSSSPKFRSGLVIAISSGVLSGFLNFGFTYGNSITQRAQILGASASNAPNALWMVLMMAGFVANTFYCCYLLFTKGTWEKYGTETLRYFSWAFVMAALWIASLVAYGCGANRIGVLGPSVGWAILMSMNIVASNAWGAVTGEWRKASRKAMRMMASGVGMLLIAVVIFVWAGTKV
jgi:L-rhamnose-H+ transport protein